MELSFVSVRRNSRSRLDRGLYNKGCDARPVPQIVPRDGVRDAGRAGLFYCGTIKDKAIVPRDKVYNNQDYSKSGSQLISALKTQKRSYMDVMLLDDVLLQCRIL